MLDRGHEVLLKVCVDLVLDGFEVVETVVVDLVEMLSLHSEQPTFVDGFI